jgi:DNA sulfur modification protein DndC
MTNGGQPNQNSAFDGLGIKQAIANAIAQIQKTYLSDGIPWVVGYSGGKDSTAVLELVWMALAGLQPDQRKKTVYVITTDTLVENPIVSTWVSKSLDNMGQTASDEGLPIVPNLLTPKIKDSFWVNLIGRGYPAPRPKFRWCTERMKINPANAFISTVVKESGEAIVVLGTRKAESTVRKARMEAAQKDRVRDSLTQHSKLTNALIYAPIEDWSNDDVWLFLMQFKNPWGYDNKDLLTMYQGASVDGECPLVIDTTTPSCGDSRFGCWVCTLVEEDKSMTAMIQNDQEKVWMRPMLSLRNAMDEHDHDKRDFRRMTGHVQLHYNGETNIPGPYTQDARNNWLRQLLEAQQTIRTDPRTPENLKNIDLVQIDELHEIRRLWVTEKHEIEDLLPVTYEEVTGEKFPSQILDDSQPFGPSEMAILAKICDGDDLLYQLTRDLLEVERSYRAVNRRSNLYSAIDKVFKKNFYDDASDAISWARQKKTINDALSDLKQQGLDLEQADKFNLPNDFEDRLAVLDQLLEDDQRVAEGQI